MTLVIGFAAVSGLAGGLRWKTSTRPLEAVGLFGLFLLLQVAAFRLSLIPYVANR